MPILRLIKSRYFIPLLAIWIIAATFLSPSQLVFAHGDGRTAELTDVVVGPYLVSVWSSPGYLRQGEIHFATAILDQTRLPVSECQVELQITPLSLSTDPIHLIARQATLTTFFEYETELDIQEPGLYQVELLVIDQEIVVGTTSFLIEITGMPLFIRLLLVIAAAVAISMITMLLYRLALFIMRKKERSNQSLY